MAINSKLATLVFLAITFGFVLTHAASAQQISSLSVTSGPVSTPVTITGSGFGTTQGDSTVTFNGSIATPSSWSDTSISVSVPVAATTGPVVVSVGGANSNSITFTVTPHIVNLSLNNGPVQMGFVINGTSFGTQQGSSTVSLGTGTTAVPLTVISWTDSAVTVAVPAAASTANVVVTVSNQASNGVTFTVVPPFGCN